LQGDNVVSKSTQTEWYNGETLLEHLEAIKVQDIYEKSQTRFPVQTVIRPKSDKFHDFRGYAGKLYGGDIAVGDLVTVLPSQATSKVKGIHFFEDSYEKAERGNSIVLSLESDIDISRGAMIVKSSELPQVKSNIESTICWMDSNPLTPSSNYIIQHGVNSVLAKIEDIHHSDEDVVQSGEQETSILKLNQIGTVKMKLSKALFVDSYKENKSNGAFILIDSKTNTTAGVGFIH
jgi:sulfate adenylyltransferase subunit 1